MAYINAKDKGIVEEPTNPVLISFFNFLEKHQAALDGSRLYDDLLDIYLFLNDELAYGGEKE